MTSQPQLRAEILSASAELDTLPAGSDERVKVLLKLMRLRKELGRLELEETKRYEKTDQQKT